MKLEYHNFENLTKKLHIKVIIPSFNRSGLLALLLVNIKNQVLPDGVKVSVLVVNDGSTDDTGEMLSRDFPEVTVVLGTGNWFYTKSINEGLREGLQSNPDYFLLMNDDTEINKDYIAKLLFATNGKECIMGSISVTIEEPHRITFSGVKEIYWWRYKSIPHLPYFHFYNSEKISGTYSSKILPGRGMLIHSSIVERIGFFDERFRQYASDDDYSLRASKAGYLTLISWDAIVWSHHRLTGSGTSYIKEPIFIYLRSYFNPVSRNYWKKYLLMIWKYGNKIMLPFTVAFVFLGNLKSFFYKYSE